MPIATVMYMFDQQKRLVPVSHSPFELYLGPFRELYSIHLVIFRHDYNHVCQALTALNIFKMNNPQTTCFIAKCILRFFPFYPYGAVYLLEME